MSTHEPERLEPEEAYLLARAALRKMIKSRIYDIYYIADKHRDWSWHRVLSEAGVPVPRRGKRTKGGLSRREYSKLAEQLVRQLCIASGADYPIRIR